jgi:hypothetical protein
MTEATREQNAAAEFVSEWYGCAAVKPSPLHHATRCVVIIGLTDNVEHSRWTIRPDGAVANVSRRDPALAEYLKRIPSQRPPMLVPREVETP